MTAPKLVPNNDFANRRNGGIACHFSHHDHWHGKHAAKQLEFHADT